MLRISLFATALLFCAAHYSYADDAGTAEKLVKADFAGWQVFSSVEGDLNGDTFKDIAIILQKPAENADDPSAVKLVVYFSDWQHRYFLQTTADKAICYGCGGAKSIWNQPFGDISIDKGVLKIEYQGGSREEFDTITKWRFDKTQKKFLLIGETERTIDTPQEEPDDTIDINFLSMKMIHSIGTKSKTCAVPAAHKAIDLAAYDYEDGSDAIMENAVKACKP